MTPSELKALKQQADPEDCFFSRDSMKFFGDTMANYGVRKTVVSKDGEEIEVYELYRKRPVKGRLQSSTYFRRDTLQRVFV